MPASRILVVDDNEVFCHNVRDVLELKGYEVATAYDGFQALELAKQEEFDLALLDVVMPLMDGVETFKRFKELAPQTPAIMVTAFAVEDLLREALRQDVFGFVRKPLDFDRLFRLIEQATAPEALVLLVDDDEGLCATMKEMLSDRGYLVSLAYDGNTAIEQARQRNFDVMLIDFKLPPLNGLETFRFIRDFRPGLAAIMISGYFQEMGDLVEQALREKARACLEKPIDMDKLLSLLEPIKRRKTGVISTDEAQF